MSHSHKNLGELGEQLALAEWPAEIEPVLGEDGVAAETLVGEGVPWLHAGQRLPVPLQLQLLQLPPGGGDDGGSLDGEDTLQHHAGLPTGTEVPPPAHEGRREIRNKWWDFLMPWEEIQITGIIHSNSYYFINLFEFSKINKTEANGNVSLKAVIHSNKST